MFLTVSISIPALWYTFLLVFLFWLIFLLTCEEDLADELVPADGVKVHHLHVERAVADLNRGKARVIQGAPKREKVSQSRTISVQIFRRWDNFIRHINSTGVWDVHSSQEPVLLLHWTYIEQGIQRLNRTAVKPVQGQQFSNKPRFQSQHFTI